MVKKVDDILSVSTQYRRATDGMARAVENKSVVNICSSDV